MKLYLILMILLSNMHAISQYEYISLPFYYSFRVVSIVQVIIGESNKSYQFVPNINSSFSFVNDNELCNSTTFSNGNYGRVVSDNEVFYYSYDLREGRVVHSQFKFKDDKDKPFDLYYYLPMENILGLHSTLGLGSAYADDKYSLIHQLKRKGLINRLAFSFVFDSSIVSKFYLGTLPQEHTRGKRHGYIDIIGSGVQWDFYLSSVQLKNNKQVITYEKKIYSYLISLSESISAPSSFFELLINEYFKEAIELKICSFQSSKPMRYLLCLRDPSLRNGEVSFIISNFAYVFHINQFWNCGEDLCVFSIRENSKEDEWIFGYDFYKDFNLLFDYTSKQVHFYISKNNTKVKILQVNTNKINTSLTVIVMTISFLFIGIGLILLLKLQLNKN